MAKLPVCVSGPVRIAGQNLDQAYFNLTQMEIGGRTSSPEAAEPRSNERQSNGTGGPVGTVAFLGRDPAGRSFVSSDLSRPFRQTGGPTIEPPSLGPHRSDILPCPGFYASFIRRRQTYFP